MTSKQTKLYAIAAITLAVICYQVFIKQTPMEVLNTHTAESIFKKRTISDYCMRSLIQDQFIVDLSFGQNRTEDGWFDLEMCVKSEPPVEIDAAVMTDEELQIETNRLKKAGKDWYPRGSIDALSEWEYVGNIGQYHIIYAITTGNQHYNSHIVVLQQDGGKMKYIDQIMGDRKAIVRVSSIKNDKMVIMSAISGQGLCQITTKLHPEFAEKCNCVDPTGELKLYSGQLIGFIEEYIPLTEDGKIDHENTEFIQYNTYEGEKYSGKDYMSNDLPDLLTHLCRAIEKE